MPIHLSPFDAAAILIVLSAVLGWVNHRYFRLPGTVAMTLMGAVASLCVIAADAVFQGSDISAQVSRFLDDIDFHGTYGAFVEWAPGPFSLGAAYRQAARSGYGGTLELRATYAAWQDGANRVNLGASTQWASHDDMQTWYGVTSSQAARSRAWKALVSS